MYRRRAPRLALLLALIPSILFAQTRPNAHCLNSEQIKSYNAEMEKMRDEINVFSLQYFPKLTEAVENANSSAEEASKCADERSSLSYNLFGAGCEREKAIVKTWVDRMNMISNLIEVFNQSAQMKTLRIREKYPICN